MSESYNYAETTDAAPLLEKMAKHADAGLPFLAIEFDPTTYRTYTAVGVSTLPTYHDIEWKDLEGSNAYDAASYRHLLAIAVGITGIDYGNGKYGVNIATEDGRHVAVVPVTEDVAYRPLNEIERKALATPPLRPPVEGSDVEEL